MANHALPTTASTYANFVSEMQARIDDSMKEAATSTVTVTNPPTNMVRWNDAGFYWEKNTGTPAAPIWSLRSNRYDININGTIGATTANTGAFTTITTSGIASLGANSTVGGVLITTATNTQTLTNKTLTTPTISTIINTGTLTLPTSTDTLIGRATADTLTNKTLTAPKISTGSSIQDVNGAVLIQFPAAIASVVNYLTLSNSITAQPPSLTASGTDVNINLALITKGTGVVTANGIQIVTVSETQTLTNKTLTTPTISSILNSGTVTIPTGTDTLVNLASVQTLTNKIINSSAFNGTVGATTASTGVFTTLNATTSLNVSGTATATTFSGAGTNLTGTANSLNIGGNAATSSAVAMSSARTDGTAYPVVWGTTGSTSQLYSCSAVTITSSTGALNASVFNGAGTGLTGTAASLSIGGNAATATTATTAGSVTNGVYITGDQTIGGTKTFSGTVTGLTAGSTTTSAFYAATTGGTYAAMYTRYAPYRTTVSHTGSSYAPSVSIFYDYIGGYQGHYSIGHLATSAANPGNLVIQHTNSSGASQNTWSFDGSNGAFTAGGNVTAYSDLRLKTDLLVIDAALEKIKQLTGYTYTRIDTGERQTGLIAQDVKKVLPEAVSEGEYLSLAYGNIVGLIIEAIKELNDKIEAMK